jgi:hypothetical protein
MTAIAVLIPIGLFFGPLLSGVAIQHGRLRELWQVPPQPISLEELVRNGPGTNPHVVLTNFRFGGNVTEGPRDNPDRFENVWIALLQTPDVPDAKMTKPEIKAVLHSKSIRNDRDLRKYLNAGRVDGICADTPTQYGAQLRKKMIDANPRASLLAVYVIQDMTEPPSADSIWAAHWGAAACLTAVLLAAVIVFLLL